MKASPLALAVAAQKAGVIPTLMNGKITIEVGGMDSREKIIFEMIDRAGYIRKHYARLVGKGIGMAEGARKYGMTISTISKYSKRGLIKILGRDTIDAEKVLVDEADIAYCAQAQKLIGGKHGQRIFKKTGELYLPKEWTAAS